MAGVYRYQDFYNELQAIGTRRVGAFRLGTFDDQDTTPLIGITMDEEQLEKIIGRLENYDTQTVSTYLLMEAAEEIPDVVSRMFDEGNGWDGIKDSTRKWRRKVGADEDGPELVAYGYLKDFIDNERGFTYTPKTVGDKTMVTVDYEKLPTAPSVYTYTNKQGESYPIYKLSIQGKVLVHNFGFGSIPARRFFPNSGRDLTVTERKKIRDSLERGLNAYLNANPSASIKVKGR